MESGVATRPISDFDAYRQQLNNFVWQSGLVMKPVFQAAKRAPKRIIFSEGESERVLRAVQTVVDEGLCRPILIGRPTWSSPTSSASACACARSSISRWSTRTPTRATTSCGATTTR
jgi:hypothetical protein